jgi:flagellar biosynthesis chaperone FliJ
MKDLDKFQEYLDNLENTIKNKYNNIKELTEEQVDELDTIFNDLENKINNLKIEE